MYVIDLIKQLNENAKESDPFEDAIKEVGYLDKAISEMSEGKCGGKKKEEEEEEHPCSKFMDPSRMNDFTKAVAEMMQKEDMSYEDAKAKAFDETEVPPAKSECCMMLRKAVDNIIKK